MWGCPVSHKERGEEEGEDREGKTEKSEGGGGFCLSLVWTVAVGEIVFCDGPDIGIFFSLLREAFVALPGFLACLGAFLAGLVQQEVDGADEHEAEDECQDPHGVEIGERLAWGNVVVRNSRQGTHSMPLPAPWLSHRWSWTMWKSPVSNV